MALTITNLGLSKAVNADQQGLTLKITHVGIGLNGYEPNKEQTQLQNEIAKVQIHGGKKVRENQVHFTALFDEDGEIKGREVGFYLSDGTLFAVDSDPVHIIMYKSGSAGSEVIESFDLVLDSVPPNSITVDVTGDLGISFCKEFAVIATAQINTMNRQVIQEFRILDIEKNQ